MSFNGFIPYLLLPAAGVSGAAFGWWLRRYLGPHDDLERRSILARESLDRLQNLANSVAANVDEHAAVVRQISAELSDSDDTSDGSVVDSVARLIQANQRMQQQLDQAEERLQAQARQIETSTVEARTDALTQVANRRAFDDALRRCVAEYKRRGRPTALMLIDVDHFKRFNDTHGHQAGDEVLKGVARVLKNSVTETEIVARYGGEEFAILFAGSSLANARQLAETARRAIASAQFTFQGRDLRVSASGGLAELTSKDDERSIVVRSDEALYAAKRNGRNCGYWNDGQANHRIIPTVSTPKPTPGSIAAGDSSSASDRDGQRTGDPQLGVSGKTQFFEDVMRRIAHFQRGGSPLTLLLLQIDGLARIADDQGKDVSARVVRVAVQLLKASMRDMDHLGQLSDDTFALLLPSANLMNAATIAERVRSNVERCRLPRPAGMSPFTVSTGCVEAIDGEEMRTLMERARRALEAAVQQGRNCTWYHDGVDPRPAADLATASY